MTRPQRAFELAPYCHVLNRGVDGQDIFGIEDDWVIFEYLLSRAALEMQLRIHAYALMTNHYHLLVEPDGCDLSAAMRDLQSSYSKWFNKRTARRGPLFEHRFIGIAVDDGPQFLQAARYVHRNPIDITGTSGLHRYRWSSLPVYLESRARPEWLATDRLGGLITPERYLERVLGADVSDLWPCAFLEPARPTSLIEIDAAIATVLGDTPRSRDEQWAGCVLAALLAREMRSADVVEIAAHHGVSPSTIRKRAERGRVLRNDDTAFKKSFTSVVNVIAAQ